MENGRQAELMAQKIPAEERERFLELWNRAVDLISEGWAVREEALTIYRRYVKTKRAD